MTVLSIAFWVIAYAVVFLFGPPWLKKFLAALLVVIALAVVIGVVVAVLIGG